MKQNQKKKRKLSKKDAAKQNKKLIRALKTENRRLRQENEYMKHLCAQYEPPEEEKPTEEQKALAECAQNADVLHAKNYFAYLLAKLRRSRLFRLFDKTRFAMKKFKFAKKLWLFSVTFFTVLGVSAQVLVVVGALMVFLPAALVLSAIIGIYSYFTHRKRKQMFQRLIDGLEEKEKVYLVFVPKNGMNGYFIRTLPALAEKGKVFAVCRSFKECESRGITQTETNIYKIHVSFYFSFVRRLPSERVVKIYL
ncbi:MAG: hypothetical protein IKD07_03440 [Clostridia bacterium]|nr:hypothetical protein [Clostridia bacterium]